MIKSILVNTSSNIVVLFLKIAVTFIMAPVLVMNLGNYDYGLWEMIGSVVGYMGMLDLGMGPAISRYAAKARSEKNDVDLQQVFSSSLVFMVLIGLLLMFAFALWGAYFPDSIAQEGRETERYTFLLMILAAQMLFIFPGRVAESYLEGFQRYQLKNNIIIVNTIVGSSILYFNITPENGLILLAAINGLGAAIKYVIYFYLLSRADVAGVSFKFEDFNLSKLRELIRFGLKSLIQGISTRIENATDTLVIGYFLGPAMVPFYSIPANLVNYIRTLGHTLTHVFMPVFSGMLSSEHNELIRKTYIQGSKYCIAIVSLISVGAVMFGSVFIEIWMGAEYAKEATAIIAVLVAFTVLPFIDPFCSRYLTAINKHSIFAKWAPVSAVINLVASCILIQSYGILGVAIGSLIPVFIFVPIYLLEVCRNIGFTWQFYVKNAVLPSLLPTLLMCLVAYYMSYHLTINTYGKLLLGGFIATITFLLVFYMLSISRNEKKYAQAKLKAIVIHFFNKRASK
jgi:O-antigen/teichoic acid export membrane protein